MPVLCVYVFLSPPQKGLVGDAQPPGGLTGGDLATLPPLRKNSEFLRQSLPLGSKPYTPGLGLCNALRLPLANILPLGLRHLAQQLQHDVRNQGARQVPPLPGVQQGHVQHYDGAFPLFGDKGPLLQNLRVVPP